MGLAVPGKVVEVFEHRGRRMGRADFGGTVRTVWLEQLPEARVGDYVLVHVGYALRRVDPGEAEQTYRLLKELGLLGELQPETEP